MKNVTAQNLGKAYQIIGAPEAMAAQKSGTYEEYEKRFEGMDDEHLIATFNGDVGKPGWTIQERPSVPRWPRNLSVAIMTIRLSGRKMYRFRGQKK